MPISILARGLYFQGLKVFLSTNRKKLGSTVVILTSFHQGVFVHAINKDEKSQIVDSMLKMIMASIVHNSRSNFKGIHFQAVTKVFTHGDCSAE